MAETVVNIQKLAQEYDSKGGLGEVKEGSDLKRAYFYMENNELHCCKKGFFNSIWMKWKSIGDEAGNYTLSNENGELRKALRQISNKEFGEVCDKNATIQGSNMYRIFAGAIQAYNDKHPSETFNITFKQPKITVQATVDISGK